VQPNSQPANEQYQKNYQKPISLNYAPKPSKKYKFATQSQVKQALQPTIQPKITTPQYSQNQPAISNQKNPQPASVKQNITPSYLVDNSGKFVQIGSFSVMSNANNVLKKASSISGGMIEEADLIGGRKIYRVMLGPIKGSTKINQVLNQAKQIGYSDAFIVK
jgi:cell division protein FtsN